MLLSCGVGEDSWESLGLQGDPTSPFSRKSVLGVHWKDWCCRCNSNTLATSCEELTHWKRPWCWEGLGAGGEGDDRGWDGWMASPTRWTWVWVNSRSWWWTGRRGVLRFMGSQRVGHDWVTELNWTELKECRAKKGLSFLSPWEFQTPLSLGNLDFLSICLGIDSLSRGHFECSSAYMGTFEGGCHYLHYLHHSLASKKQENSRKTSISALLATPKPFTVWITINCGKFWRRWNTRPPDLPLEKPVCRSVSNS